MPYTQSYTVGWQRKLGRDTAFEVRYVGSRHRQDWETMNINETNITTNGFLDEFRKAQANLQANIAAGRGNTFAYTGAPGTVAAADHSLAYFNASARRAGRRRRRGTPSAQLDQRDEPRLPRRAEPEPVRLRLDEHDDAASSATRTFRNNARRRRPAGELLRREPGRARRRATARRAT